MINQQTIKQVIDTWLKDILKKKIIDRNEIELLKKYLPHKQAVAISGIRRSGKTYLMFQMIKKLLADCPQNILYINFEDERFNNDVSQLDLIYRTFLEYKNPKKRIYFFLDEIQNIIGWERWVARMYEKNIKFFISGSNASLLSSDFSKSLSGRHKLIELFPLSFKQFVDFKNRELLKDSLHIVENIAQLKHFLGEYLRWGGFPEVIYEKRKDVLRDYYRDIINRDIILRRNIKFKDSLREISIFLITNIGRLHSLYSLNKIFKGHSINTIKNYISFLEDAYLIFRIPYFSFSLKKQLANPFKVYVTDPGLRNEISFRFSQDIGWLYENIVAVELLRRHQKENIFYWKNAKDKEVDFLIKQGLEIKQLIQVCYNIEDLELKKREVKNLLKASEVFKCRNLLIITQDYESQEGKIQFIPLWKWLIK